MDPNHIPNFSNLSKSIIILGDDSIAQNSRRRVEINLNEVHNKTNELRTFATEFINELRTNTQKLMANLRCVVEDDKQRMISTKFSNIEISSYLDAKDQDIKSLEGNIEQELTKMRHFETTLRNSLSFPN